MKLDWQKFNEGFQGHLKEAATAASTAPAVTPAPVNVQGAPGGFGRALGGFGAVSDALSTHENLSKGNYGAAAVNATGLASNLAYAAPGTAMKVLGPKAFTRVVPGLGAIDSGYSAYKRFGKGDYIGAGIDTIGAGLAFVPGVNIVGPMAAGAINAYRDYRKDDAKLTQKAETSLGHEGASSVNTYNPTQTTQPPATPQPAAPQPATPQNAIGTDLSKQGDMLTDTVASAIKGRLGNIAIDKLSGIEAKKNKKKKDTDKHLEIISKYPELQKTLEDAKNRAYLEKLLTE